jgi:hypothetical protein
MASGIHKLWTPSWFRLLSLLDGRQMGDLEFVLSVHRVHFAKDIRVKLALVESDRGLELVFCVLQYQ